MSIRRKSIIAAVGGAFATSLATTPALGAAHNPFAATSLGSGYMVAEAEMPADAAASDDGKMKDGKCAAGKCGSSMKKKKAKAKADAESKAKEGNCGSEKGKEGSCSSEKK
jgi:uncharacterized low-complexity protein